MYTHIRTCAVKSWDGSESVVDSSVMPDEGQKRVSDPWDKELDRGKVSRLEFSVQRCVTFFVCFQVKNVKKKQEEDYSRNQFQGVQNKRNVSYFVLTCTTLLNTLSFFMAERS